MPGRRSCMIKFDVLSKYYFVHSQGQKQTTGTVEEQTLDSSCTGMKGMQVKDKAAMDIMMDKTSSANRPDPENVSSSFSEASESFKLLLKFGRSQIFEAQDEQPLQE